MSRFFQFAYFAITTCSFVLAAYPTTYPFENEAFVPVAIAPGTPDFTFLDATDPGGYGYYGMEKITLLGGTVTDEDFPYIPHDTMFTAWLIVKVYGAPPVLPKSNWNCTLKETVLSEADFTGEVDGTTICTVGQCCKSLIGQPKYGDDQMAWHSWANDRSASGLCGPIEIEDLYCVTTGGHWHLNCMEYFLSPSERLVTTICYDVVVLYWMTCAVFKQAYAWSYQAGKQDSPIYQANLSNEEQIASDGAFTYGDRVCNPYSYYVPTSTSNSDDDATKQDSSSSGINACWFIAVLAIFF